ncbi:MAG: cysteine desulfurase [Micavibrio aeruginosavorus]|uniref:Cysteine desulfurase n=1 Tax=Micavibrio aeruginosavorus TaxID=349221 RepID=A0A2W5Q5A3_9BACT|nr:MAG: cysteine desulfurase [Micavibrio aeruginosavorus]
MAVLQDIGYCREDFPILAEPMNGKPLAYLDTASSAQKPSAVIEKIYDTMSHYYANIHRGLYFLSQTATQEYEAVRGKVKDFINAPSEHEVVFTRNSTEAINLVAQSWGAINLQSGDDVILTAMEHHANIVPWQLLQDKIGFSISVAPVLPDGTLDLDAYKELVSPKTKFIGIVHISNALGTINPVEHMIGIARGINPDVKILIDASQSVVHGHVDVQAMDCDFLTFTGHKLYGPTGSGVLWGREEILNAMRPYQGGGDMIERVSFSGTTYKKAPARFEAGTPAFVDVIGLGAAIDYVRTIGQDNIAAHEKELLDYAMQGLARIDGLTFYGATQDKAAILSFTANWAQSSDIAMILDKQGVAVRAGHHCCMPLMESLGIDGTIRASIGLYTNRNDIDSLVQGLRKAKEMLS